MDPTLRATLGQRLGARIVGATRVSGGDINQAFRVEASDGRAWFVKSHPRALPKMFEAEAHGLDWLREARALRVPAVVASGDGEDGGAAFLALEFIEPGRRGRGFDEQLGRGLAALHAHGADGFGLGRDNYLATLPQRGFSTLDWPRFYAEQRLEPLLRRASDQGRTGTNLRSDFARLFARMAELCGPDEPPARLHGDLWGGNVLSDARGEPVLIDPAVYGGHREVDLAMMQLFGGFGPRCFAAYDEAFPRAHGHERRVPLYQLYPLLVHLCLFGGGYAAQVEHALERALSA